MLQSDLLQSKGYDRIRMQSAGGTVQNATTRNGNRVRC
jgi:hypothetical protein